ncbi:MAG: signal peptidase II [Coriobacteriia bacterium]|nr:signal peptidase II [Coriobacteriia bacterium]
MKAVPRRLALIVCLILATMVIVFDQITKSIAESALSDSPKAFIPGLIEFRLAYNRGAAWGILQGARPFFLLIAAITVVAVIAYLMTQKQHPLMVVLGFGVFVGGSIGNGIDRFMNSRVIDFINLLFIDFPVFNVADCAITIGAMLVLLSIVISSVQERSSKAAGNSRPTNTKKAQSGRAAGQSGPSANNMDNKAASRPSSNTAKPLDRDTSLDIGQQKAPASRLAADGETDDVG